MGFETRLLRTLGKHFERRLPNTQPEYAKVVQVDPLVLQLDYDEKIQLRYEDGDFTMNDQIVLGSGDKVVIMEMMGGHQYHVFDRVGGPIGVSVVGDREEAQALAFAGGVTGPGTAVNGHSHDLPTVGTTKLKAE